MKIAITFGAFAPRISEQLEQHGMKARTADVVAWQRDAEAITRLAVRGLLTEAGGSAARRKLLRKILAGSDGDNGSTK
jgi:hypothetical protein